MKPYLRHFLLAIALFSLFYPFASRAEAQRAQFASPILVVNTSFLNVRTGPSVEYSVLVTVVGGTELPVLARAKDNVWYQVATDGGAGWVNVEFTLARGDFSNIAILSSSDIAQVQPTTTGTTSVTSSKRYTGVTFPGGDIWSEPNYSSLIIKSAFTGSPDVIYPLLGVTKDSAGAEWYLLNIPNIGTGWVTRINYRPLACENDVVGVIPGEPLIRFDGIANRDAFPLSRGTEVYIRGRQDIFAIVELMDGTRGLVIAEEVIPRSSSVISLCDIIPASLGQGGGSMPSTNTSPVQQPTGNVIVVNTGNLNIRSGPSADYSIVATVPGGTVLSVLGRAKDGVWFLVQGNFGQGWLNVQFGLFRGSYASVPVISSDAIPAPSTSSNANAGQGGGGNISQGTTFYGVVFLGGDLFSEPNYSSLVIRSALTGDPNIVYPLLNATKDSSGGDWYQIEVPSIGVGWVTRVSYRPLACGSDVVGVVNGEPLIRFDGIANRSGFPLAPGTEFYIRGRQGDFALVELLDGTMGLVFAAEVTVRSDSVVSICNITSTQTTVTAGGATTNNNQPSVVSSSQITTGNHVVINTGNLNVRSGPSASYTPVATVAGGTRLSVVGRANDGVWFLVEGSFGQGWVNNQFTLFRGNYATVPVVDFSGN